MGSGDSVNMDLLSDSLVFPDDLATLDFIKKFLTAKNLKIRQLTDQVCAYQKELAETREENIRLQNSQLRCAELEGEVRTLHGQLKAVILNSHVASKSSSLSPRPSNVQSSAVSATELSTPPSIPPAEPISRTVPNHCKNDVPSSPESVESIEDGQSGLIITQSKVQPSLWPGANLQPYIDSPGSSFIPLDDDNTTDLVQHHTDEPVNLSSSASTCSIEVPKDSGGFLITASEMSQGMPSADVSGEGSNEGSVQGVGRPRGRKGRTKAKCAVRNGPTGGPPFVCTICGMLFTQYGNRERHMRRHTGQKPYECTLCGLKFARSDKMTRHQRTVHRTVCPGSTSPPEPPGSTTSTSPTPLLTTTSPLVTTT